MIRFESKTGPGVSMLVQDSRHLLKLMQHSHDVPGIILAEDINTHLENLRTAIRDEASAGELSNDATDNNDSSNDIPVTLSTRAYPLIKLLEAAHIKQENVMWDHDNSIV